MPGPIREYPLDRCDQFLAKCKSNKKAIKVFATGDSWLAAPGGWWRGSSVVALLNNDRWVRSIVPGHPGFNVLSIAKVGFRIDSMPTDHDLLALDYVRGEFGRQNIPFAFDAFMVSAGGNDFIPKMDTFVSGGNGVAAIDAAALGAIFDMIRTRWGELLQRLAPGDVPVLTNGYGPVIPTLKAGTTWLPLLNTGPWVGPWLLQHCGLTDAKALALAGDVIDRFNTFLAAIPRLRYFDVRSTVRAMPPSMWHDEIHFVAEGWEQIAQRWMAELDAATGRTPRVAVELRDLRLPAVAILRAAPGALAPARAARKAGKTGIKARKTPTRAARDRVADKGKKAAGRKTAKPAKTASASRRGPSRRKRNG